MVNFAEVLSIEFNREDKEKFKAIIKVLVDLSNKAHRQGILSLEDNYSSLNPFLLRKGIELILEGCSTKELRNIIDNYIQIKRCSNTELLERHIIREGVILIQNNNSGKLLFEKILSMLGEDFFEDFHYSIIEEEPAYEYHSNGIKVVDNETELFFNQLMSIGNFQEELIKIDDFEEMQRLIMRAGYVHMAIALNGADYKLKRHVINNLSFRNMVDELRQEIKNIGNCKFEDILNAQQFILRLINN